MCLGVNIFIHPSCVACVQLRFSTCIKYIKEKYSFSLKGIQLIKLKNRIAPLITLSVCYHISR